MRRPGKRVGKTKKGTKQKLGYNGMSAKKLAKATDFALSIGLRTQKVQSVGMKAN
jgi:hypothetical protein